MRSPNAIRSEMINNISTTSKANYLGAGSIFKNLIDSTALQVSKLEEYTSKQAMRTRVSESRNLDLEAIAADYNLYRIKAKRASSRISDKNIRVTLKAGFKASDISSNVNQYLIGKEIYAGERRYVIKNSNASPDSTVFYLEIEAFGIGSAYNIPSFSIDNNNLGTSFNRVATVNNVRPIINGTDRESDANLKSRIQNRIISLQKCNESAVSEAIRVIPGIGKFNLLTNYGSLGSFGLIIQPTIGAVSSESLLSSVRSSLNNNIAAGSTVTVKTAIVKKIKIISKIKTTRILNQDEKNRLLDLLNNKMISLMSAREIGSHLDLIFISNELKATSSLIDTIGYLDRVDQVSVSIEDQDTNFIINIDPRENGVLRCEPNEIIILDDTPTEITIL